MAGNVEPYEFILPPSWKQTRVANILSGNYCQPKCAEPWVEVKFEDEKQGKVQVVASPLIRLTNKPNATIEEIGSPEKVIASLGPFVTGNTFDSDELLETSIEKRGDLTVTFLLLASMCPNKACFLFICFIYPFSSMHPFYQCLSSEKKKARDFLVLRRVKDIQSLDKFIRPLLYRMLGFKN